MRNKLLYTSGLKSMVFAGIVLLSSCTAPTGHDTADSPAIQTPDKNKQSVRVKPDIPLACAASLLRPAKFITHSERIPVFEPTPEFENVPAIVDWGIKRIQVEPARFTNETVPALYRKETEKVLVMRERHELRGIPAVYKTIDRPVTMMPAHVRWKNNCTNRQNPTVCFENVPAETRIVKRQIIDIPNRIIQKHLPAEIIEITKKILVKPGQGTGPIIPARYIDVKVGKVKRVWTIKSTHNTYTKPRYETIQVQIKSREDQIRKFPVLCSNASPVHIREIQQRLKWQGFPAGMTGKLDKQSMKALTRFQQANDLFIGAVSPETLEKLGLR
ncbi:MAG: Unknown protein [uncultured Thiotrichaceae bacterium]|uniref:Peptidoglycan binding-like domain-containing protein n=1 Tax=uncultured Thiotrichaceae bacterium TaxID=298394 RepID=A0A6S6SYJ3_9GAMM|nr:MAG: Unknown protein [uncultured Thiotrichaceae bacterium]